MLAMAILVFMRINRNGNELHDFLMFYTEYFKSFLFSFGFEIVVFKLTIKRNLKFGTVTFYGK